MKSSRVHLKNKYPTSRITVTGHSMSVHSERGELLVELQKDCHGGFSCNQKESGARDAFCLSPIPKNARAFKLYADGRIGTAEEYEKRIICGIELAKKDGRVPSIQELKEKKQFQHLIESEK